MRIIIFLISILILCSINLTNCQLTFPTSPLNLTTAPSLPSLTPFPGPSQASPIQPSAVVVSSTTTTYVGPAVTTLSPTETVVAYVTVDKKKKKKSSSNKILLNLWNIGIFSIISTIAVYLN